MEKSLEIDTKYTQTELFDFTEKTIRNANELHQKLAKNDSVKVDFPFSKKEIYKTAAKAYKLNHFDIQGVTNFRLFPSVKSSLYSTALTYMGYSGYLNPFTNEAQINGKMIGYSLPITTCHEMAHQIGYAAEHEANFLAYITAQNTDNQHFKYSASLFALRYLLSEVYKISPEKHSEYIKKIRKGIFENYSEVRNFWKQYENKSEAVFKTTYDTFLKANNQKQGIESYNDVVGLLIGFERKSKY